MLQSRQITIFALSAAGVFLLLFGLTRQHGVTVFTDTSAAMPVNDLSSQNAQLIVSPSVQDLGEIAPGRPHCRFNLTNKLHVSLPITIKVDCDCMRIISCPDQIGANSQSTAEIEIDLENTNGSFTRRCTFLSPSFPKLIATATVHGSVNPNGQINLSSEVVDMGDIYFGDTGVATVHLETARGTPLGPVDIKVSAPFTANFVADKSKPSTGCIELAFIPDHYPQSVTGHITVKGSSFQRGYDIVVLARVFGPIRFSADSVLLGRVITDQIFAGQILITGPSALMDGIEISHAEIPAGIQATGKYISSQCYEIDVSGRLSLSALTVIRSQLSVRTKAPGCSKVDIPILGVVAD